MRGTKKGQHGSMARAFCRKRPRWRYFSAYTELPIRVYLSSGEGISYSLNYHPEIEFQFIQRGEGEYYINGIRYAFRRNSFLIIKPNEKHYGIPRRGSHVDKVYLNFSRKLVDGIWSSKDLAELPYVLQLSEEEAAHVIFLMRAISGEINGKAFHWREKILCEIKILLILLSRWQKGEDRRPHQHSILNKVLSFIEDHFVEPISLTALSARFHLSPSRLSHVFKRGVGLGVKTYVLQRRIAEAKIILEKNNLPKIEVISELVGFSDYRLFNRHFKRLTGYTASAYRTFQAKIAKTLSAGNHG